MATVTPTYVSRSCLASSASHVINGVTIGAGRLAIIRGGFNSDTISVSSVTDSAGNTWNVAIEQDSTAIGGATTCFIAYCVLVNALSNGSITINLSSATGLAADLAHFESDAGWEPQASVLDKTSGGNFSNATPWSSNSTPTTTVDDELLIGCAAHLNNNGSSSTPSAGWTEDAAAADANCDNAGTTWLVSQYQKVTAAGVYAAQGTWGAAEYGAAAIATFITAGQELPNYPVPEDVAESANPTTAVTSHTVTYPTGIQAGETLLMIGNKGSTAATVNAIAGWTELIDENLANGLYAAWKKADGTESGTFTLTTSAGTRFPAMIYRLSNAGDPTVTPPEIGSTASGSSTTPDPPSLSPSGGQKDYLFIAFAGMAGEEADDDTWVNTPPTNYGPTPPRQKSCGTVGTNLGGKLMAAERGTSAATEDPGSFAVDVSAAWRANTIAIYPAGPSTKYGQVAAAFTFGKAVAGQRQTFSQIVFPITATIATAGIRVGNTYYGIVALPMTFSKEVLGQRKTFGQIALPIILAKEFIGQRKTFSQIASPFTISIATDGYRVGNTFFGSLVFPVTFGKNVLGQRKAFGQIAVPIVFAKETSGRRQTFGQTAFPIIFAKEITGRRTTFSQFAFPITFTKQVAGSKKTFGQLDFPILFSKSVIHHIHAHGSLALPVNFVAFVDGQVFTGPKTLYGRLDLPINFSKEVLAQRKTFGQISAPLIFGFVSQGERTTFSNIELPIDFESIIQSGPVTVFEQVALDIILGINTKGIIKLPGIILNEALDLYLGDQHIIAAYFGSEQIWP